MNITIRPEGSLKGRLRMPGDKSISHRAVMIGAIAKGTSSIKDVLDCDDCNYTMRAFKDMGVDIAADGAYTIVKGAGLRGLKMPAAGINLGESGTSMRLLAGILAGQRFSCVLECSPSLSKRPMKRVVEPLSLMGVDIRTAAGGFPPIMVEGGSVRPINYSLPVPSAQIKSAVLLAGLYADGVTTVEERFRSRDHTERMLKYFGAGIEADGLKVSVRGNRELEGRSLEIPGDISSAAFFIAAAILVKGSVVRIENVNINPTRSGMLDVLKMMGAKLNVTDRGGAFEPVGDIEASSGRLNGVTIEESMIPSLIDELPVIFTLAAFAKGRTVVKGADELKVKETNRIVSMKDNLERMGASVKIEGGDIIIDGSSSLRGGRFDSYGDHRTCMAMAVAALAAGAPSEITGCECVSKSFPGFFKTLETVRGA